MDKDQLKAAASTALSKILDFWLTHTMDEKHGGFIGRMDANHQIEPEAEKGAVLNARILWAFSAAYRENPAPAYLAAAQRAFQYLLQYFYNPRHQGIYWSVHFDGRPKDTKNQVYALAFVIYGLSEYYAVTGDSLALERSITLYQQIQNHSFDNIYNGYGEAYTHDWQPISDMRLSDKDANEKKTMNTHLHIAEGFANLYRVWPNEKLRQDIAQLLDLIHQKFIDKKSFHLYLFFDEQWQHKTQTISYGHDIEAAWLLQWCATAIGDTALIENYQTLALKFAESTLEGIDSDGGLWYEFHLPSSSLKKEKHWWPQAELLIGYINAWQLSKDGNYLAIAIKNWNFIASHIIDPETGEWIWGVDENLQPLKEDIVGFWKGPYHNTRACMELMKRL